VWRAFTAGHHSDCGGSQRRRRRSRRHHHSLCRPDKVSLTVHIKLATDQGIFTAQSAGEFSHQPFHTCPASPL